MGTPTPRLPQVVFSNSSQLLALAEGGVRVSGTWGLFWCVEGWATGARAPLSPSGPLLQLFCSLCQRVKNAVQLARGWLGG